jgi:Uma2 family endonuclease
MVIVMPTAVALVTFEDLERLPNEPGKTELLDGELIQMPPAILPHNRLAKQLFLRLYPIVESLRAGGAALELGEVEFEMGYKIGSKPDSWLVPDLSIADRDQTASEKYYEGAPLIAIEIISESNTTRHVDRKTKKYLANGSQEVWVLYPKTRRAPTHFAGHDR